jgi:hypothetical protein
MLNSELIILNDLLCSTEFCENDLFRISDYNTGKVYFSGTFEELPIHELYEKARNMWVYGYVKSITPLLVTYLGKRKLTLSIGVSWGDKADEVNE